MQVRPIAGQSRKRERSTHLLNINNSAVIGSINISLYLAGHNTVWRKNDAKPALTAATGFLEDQDAVLSRS